MANLTTAIAGELLDHLTNNGAYTPTFPLELALVTVLGTASSAGTEMVGGTYARQTATFGPQVNAVASNSGQIAFTNLPAGTIVGGEIYDSVGARVLFGAFSSNITVNEGDDLIFDVGDLTLTAA